MADGVGFEFGRAVTATETRRWGGGPWLPWAAVIAIIGLHLALTADWMTRTGYFVRPPTMDAPYFRMEVVPMLEGLERDGLAGWVEAGRSHDKRTPPLMHMLTALLAGLDGGRDITPIILWRCTAIFWVIFALGVRRLAGNFGGPWTAVLAVLLACSAPVVISWMRPYYRQLPMAAVDVWVLDALLRSRGFLRFGPSVAAGFLAGLAFLVKELVPVYVGGPVVAALIHGLVRPGTRLRVAVNALSALTAAAIVAAFWYWEHWPLVLDYASDVTGEEGQQTWSLGVPFWSWERWLYYPLHFINGGFGLLLGLLATLLFGRDLVLRRQRRSRSGPSAGPEDSWRAWIVAAGVLVAFPLITIGQIEGAATFTVDFVPAAAVGLAALLARSRPDRARRALVAAAILACAWQTFVSYRDPDHDRPIPESFPLKLAARTDVIMSAKWQACALSADPAAEPWPLAAFAERILRESPLPVPRLGLIPVWQDAHADPFNIAHEAWRLGGRIQLVAMHRAHRLDGAALREIIEKTDYLVLAHRANSVDPAIRPRTRQEQQTMIDGLQLPLEIIETCEVTSLAVLSLMRVRRPWATGLLRPLSTLDAAGVIRGEAVFANGWRLLGWQPFGVDGDRFAVTTYWTQGPDPVSRARLVFTAEFGGGGRLRARWTGELTLPFGGAGPGTVLAVSSDRMKFPAGASPPVKGRLTLEKIPLRANERKEPVPIVTTTFPRRGTMSVLLLP